MKEYIFSDVGHDKTQNQQKPTAPSTLVNAIGNRVFGSGKRSQLPQQKPPSNPSFRTAGTELVNDPSSIKKDC